MKLITRKIDSLEDVSHAAWNNLEHRGNPFLTHQFLAGLEKYKCLYNHGWHPCHILAEDNNELVGALPLYFKTNSVGEFVFDWNWAEAYEQAGGHYYPKLVSAVPFSPVSGPRYLIKKNHDYKNEISDALYKAARLIVQETRISGIHILFPDEVDHKILVNQGLLIRTACQYHWFNHEYCDFDDFLSHLNSKKRKQIKRERDSVSKSGIEIEVLRGEEITLEHWQEYYNFYTSTFLRKWGEPRFTLTFFQSLSQTLGDIVLLFLAKYNGKYVAGAFAMQGENTLYGRHWGCNTHFPFLHFELCYYQTIDYCIQNKLGKLDAGVQGEHKISRGFVPVNTWSAHWIANIEFRKTIEHFLHHEQKYIELYMNGLSEHLAYKTL